MKDTKMPSTKQKPICVECGSENVNLDATAMWDVEKQDWVLAYTYDDAFCCDCEMDNISLNWVTVKE